MKGPTSIPPQEQRGGNRTQGLENPRNDADLSWLTRLYPKFHTIYGAKNPRDCILRTATRPTKCVSRRPVPAARRTCANAARFVEISVDHRSGGRRARPLWIEGRSRIVLKQVRTLTPPPPPPAREDFLGIPLGAIISGRTQSTFGKTTRASTTYEFSSQPCAIHGYEIPDGCEVTLAQAGSVLGPIGNRHADMYNADEMDGTGRFCDKKPRRTGGRDGGSARPVRLSTMWLDGSMPLSTDWYSVRDGGFRDGSDTTSRHSGLEFGSTFSVRRGSDSNEGEEAEEMSRCEGQRAVLRRRFFKPPLHPGGRAGEKKLGGGRDGWGHCYRQIRACDHESGGKLAHFQSKSLAPTH